MKPGDSSAPDLYHEVRYEELVSEPEGTCETLCTFLGLPYDDAMLRFHEGGRCRTPASTQRRRGGPSRPG